MHESGSTLLIAHAEDAGALGDGARRHPAAHAARRHLGAVGPADRRRARLRGADPGPLAGQPHFDIADVGLVEELGEQLALAIRVDRLFRHRVDIADALQTSLLPRQVRQIPGTEIAAAHVAATSDAEAGGDFYDVYPARDGWGIAIGDVCGKGAGHRGRDRGGAALDPGARAPGRRSRGGAARHQRDHAGRGFRRPVRHRDAATWSWREDGCTVPVASAGHPGPVLLIAPTAAPRTLQGGGLPLGIFPDAEPAAQQVDHGPGDLLFLYTDGLTSACGPDLAQFEDRLIDELAALAGKPPAVLVSRVRDVVLELCRGELRDDMTMLALRVGEPPG